MGTDRDASLMVFLSHPQTCPTALAQLVGLYPPANSGNTEPVLLLVYVYAQNKLLAAPELHHRFLSRISAYQVQSWMAILTPRKAVGP
jgi:hypothetical protein